VEWLERKESFRRKSGSGWEREGGGDWGGERGVMSIERVG